ncbi:MAG: hypothetical protein C4344_06275 [Acidimicrobiia bacterium]
MEDPGQQRVQNPLESVPGPVEVGRDGAQVHRLARDGVELLAVVTGSLGDERFGKIRSDDGH